MLVTFPIRKIIEFFYVAVNTTHVGQNVTLAVQALNRRLGGSRSITIHLGVNLATVSNTALNVFMIKKWTESVCLSTYMANTKAEVFVKTVNTTRKA